MDRNIHVILVSVIVTALAVKGFKPTNSQQQKILDWEAPKKFSAKFPYYFSGFDYEDRPVWELGNWDTRSVVEEGGEQLEFLIKRNDQLVERLRAGFFHRNLNVSDLTSDDNEVVLVIDFDGFQLDQIMSAKNVLFMQKNFESLETVASKIAYGFIVNANPTVEHAVQVGKPLMGKFLQKIEIYGTNSRSWVPILLRKIPGSELHPKYGGRKDFLPIAVY